MSLRAMKLSNVQIASGVRPDNINPRLYPTDSTWQDTANNREIRILTEDQYNSFLAQYQNGSLNTDITLLANEAAIDAELTIWGAMDTVYSIDYPALAAENCRAESIDITPPYPSAVTLEQYLFDQGVAGVSSDTPTRLTAAEMLARWEDRGYGE